MLKLKEISYLHAGAYAADEMTHSPITLINESFSVIAIATKGPMYDKDVSNLQGSRARGAKIVAVASEGDEDIRAHADHVIYVPKVRECFVPIVASVPPATVRPRDRLAPRVRCRPAQEPHQERDGGVRRSVASCNQRGLSVSQGECRLTDVITKGEGTIANAYGHVLLGFCREEKKESE